MLRNLFDIFKKNAWAERRHTQADMRIGAMVESLKEIVWAIEEQTSKNPVINYIAETKYSEILLILLSLKIQNKLVGKASIDDVKQFIETELKADPDLASLFERTDAVNYPEVNEYNQFQYDTNSYKKRLSEFFNDIAETKRRLPKETIDRDSKQIEAELDTYEQRSEAIHTSLLFRHLLLTSQQRETELNLRNRLNHALDQYYKFFEGCAELDAEKVQSALDHMPYDDLSLKVFLCLLETAHINGKSMADYINANRKKLDPDYTICGTLCFHAVQNGTEPYEIIEATHPLRKTVEFVRAPC